MVLLIGGVKVDEVPHDSRSLYTIFPQLKEGAVQIASTISKQSRLREMDIPFAEKGKEENIDVIGTDDCTTCLAVVLRHPASGVCSVGHLESVTASGLTLMLNRLQDLSLGYFDQGPVHMHIYGSFSDHHHFSEEVIYSVLQHISKVPTEVELVSACVGDLNTVVRGDIPWPIIYGIGINVKTGEIFPASFQDKGPDLPLRHSRLFTGEHTLLDIYDYTSGSGLGLLKIGPFNYEPLRSAKEILQQSDNFILTHLTTSPEVEPPHVVSEIKETLRHIQEHPFPAITVFAENRGRYYRKEENGQWTLVRIDSFRYDALN